MDLTEKNELVFLPLGGAGEIGMNLNLYGFNGQWLMVDLGITFPDDSTPGIDVIMPDPSFIENERDNLLALVVTHAHEDHLGAIAHLWDRLRCPVYASKFAMALLRAKLIEADLLHLVELHEIDFADRLHLGPFELEFIPLTHSIPEMAALAIHTKLGTVVHTGDWKLDPDPVVGPPSDQDALVRLGDAGVLALVCDSTNAMEPGISGSEADVRTCLTELIGQQKGRVAVTSFASNVARIESVTTAALANGRRVTLVGRSMHRIVGAAREAGYLKDLPAFVPEREAGYLPPDKILYLCTGCQGEIRGAMARIAYDQHRDVVLSHGDTVIFSSRMIPGNEAAILRMQERLVESGVKVITADDAMVHVSGHPCQDELAQMYQMIRPEIAVPVHGERAHLRAHAALADDLQVPQVVVIGNGEMLRLAPGPVEIIDHVPAGRLGLDGRTLVPMDGQALKERRRIMFNGAAVATLVINTAGELLAPPSVVLKGLAEDGGQQGDLAKLVADLIADAVAALPRKKRRDANQVEEAARLAMGRLVRRHTGRRPSVDVDVITVANSTGSDESDLIENGQPISD